MMPLKGVQQPTYRFIGEGQKSKGFGSVSASLGYVSRDGRRRKQNVSAHSEVQFPPRSLIVWWVLSGLRFSLGGKLFILPSLDLAPSRRMASPAHLGHVRDGLARSKRVRGPHRPYGRGHSLFFRKAYGFRRLANPPPSLLRAWTHGRL